MICISVIGTLADKYILGRELSSFRKELNIFWIKFTTPKAIELTKACNQLFIEFFDNIYGRETFSKKRLIASIIASTLSYVIVATILYLYNGAHILLNTNFNHLILALFFIAILNYIPDYFSLAETRLILNASKDKNILGLLFLILIDFLLTTFIFSIYICIIFTVISDYFIPKILLHISYFAFDAFKELPLEDIVILFGASCLTTYVTSVMWLLFILTYIAIRVSYLLFPISKYFYEQIAVSGQPITVIAGLLNISIISLFLIWTIASVIFN